MPRGEGMDPALDPARRGRERVSWAGLLLAGALWIPALEVSPELAEPCTEPVERAARAGHTTQVACAPDADAPSLRGPARLLYGLPLDPNRADQRTLEVLPGIGPARAEAILHERARAPFARVDDLLRVPGIGPVTLSRIAPLLRVSPGPTGGSRSGESVGCSGTRHVDGEGCS